MKEKNIEFKLVIELDDKKLGKDNYDIEDTYRIVRENLILCLMVQ